MYTGKLCPVCVQMNVSAQWCVTLYKTVQRETQETKEEEEDK